jgi:NADH-quinone oxidoreductase subunit H
MRFGWKVLLPINLVWILLLAGLRTLQKEDVSTTQRYLIIGGAVLTVLLLALLWPERKEPAVPSLEDQARSRPPGSFPLPPMDLQVPPSPRLKRLVAEREPAGVVGPGEASGGAGRPDEKEV